MSINYLNDTQYINDELETLDIYVIEIQNDLRLLHQNNCFDSKFKYITYLRNKSKKQIMPYIKKFLEYNPENKSHARNKEDFEYFLDFAKTTFDYQNETTNLTKVDNTLLKCIICNMEFNTTKLYNDHIRNDNDCSIYHKIDSLIPKKCPNKGCNTTWDTYNDLNKHIKFHCHLTEEEKNIDHNNQFTLDRRYFINHGLPMENTHIANGNILYDALSKEWKCEI